MHGLRMWSVAGLGLLASSNLIEAQSANSSQEEALAHHLDLYWSYGRSPPVYPSPQMSGTGDWAEAYQFAKDMVAKMTNNEKNNITYGQDAPNGCSGTTGSIPRLGFPGMCMNDAENGVRGQDGVNGYPSGIHVGASWNRALTLARAQYMGAEFKRKGVNVALGPVAGPLGRIARGGRNWEGFANDPYLSGRLIYETVRGMQENVIACVKHWIAYEQETNRVPPALNLSSFNASMSSNVDDKTMHETYMWPFADAVKAGVGSVMCVYNQINGSYGCQNSKTMNGLLKGELGFQGFVVTDWGAGYSGLASAQAGLDLYMPNSPFWQDGNLTLMVKNGSMAQSRLDDMATRIIATWYKHSRLDDPGNGMPVSLLEPHKLVDARDPMSSPVILQGGIEGHVLVKNERGALPLQKPQMLSLYGYDAIAAPRNMEYVSNGFNHWDLGLEGAQTIPGVGDFNITYIRSTFQSNESASNPLPNSAYNGTMYTGGGSGATTPAYIDAPFNAIQRQAMKDGTLLSWDFQSFNPTVNPATDACLVFINELASEGWDRPSLADDLSDELVKNVAANCSNTQVIIHNAGIRLVDSWIDHPNITAVVFAHLPGQDTGEALVQLLYGKQSFSGRLPYTVAKNESDYGLLLGPVVPDNTTEWHTQANFTEGNLIDYKHFIAQNITPRYAFGFGLTYTTFNYTDLQARVVTNISMLTPLRSRSNNASQDDPEAEGGDPALWDKVAEVRATITNSGSVAAAEVPQLYVQIPGGPAWQLRGFEKPYLRPGASATVQFPLLRRDLSSWNVTSQTWDLQRGRYPVFVGGNVLDQQLKGEITI